MQNCLKKKMPSLFRIIYERGPQYSVGNVELKSKLINIDLSSFHKAIKLNPGDLYSSKRIEIEAAFLENLLQIKGFNFVNVVPKITRNLKDLTIDIVFNFEQSERIFIGRIDITGNIATLDRVIRRQFFINEGDPINPNEIKAAVERIRALDLFSKVEVKTVPGKRQSEVTCALKYKKTHWNFIF